MFSFPSDVEDVAREAERVGEVVQERRPNVQKNIASDTVEALMAVDGFSDVRASVSRSSPLVFIVRRLTSSTREQLHSIYYYIICVHGKRQEADAAVGQQKQHKPVDGIP